MLKHKEPLMTSALPDLPVAPFETLHCANVMLLPAVTQQPRKTTVRMRTLRAITKKIPAPVSRVAQS
jgi:hypothetical protein